MSRTEILEIKTGGVDIDNIQKYNHLIKELSFWKARLRCVQGDAFDYGVFTLGNYKSFDSFENRDYLMLRRDKDNDKRLKADIINFLTCKIIDEINNVTKDINELIK
jgi:hypothetical protein